MIHTSRLPAPELPDLSLTEFVLERAGEWAEHVAVIDGITGESLRYRELVDAVARMATALRATGVDSGSVVALLAANQPQWLVAFHATVSAGAAMTPINPAFTVDELCTVLRAARATSIVTDPASETRARSAAAALGGVRVLVLGGGGDDDLTVLAAAQDATAHDAARAPRPPDPGSVAALPFSSGTTGLPKGVVLSHRNLVATLAQHDAVYHLGPDDVVLAVLPLFHIYGMSIIADYALRNGATVVTLPRFEPTAVLSSIATHGVTALHMAPPTVGYVAGFPVAAAEFAGIRFAMSGAAPLDPGLQVRAEAALGCRIGQGYGLTEASPGVTFVPDDLDEPPPVGTVGVLVAGTDARVVDPATGADVTERGASGELWVRGPQVMSGYAGDPDATAATIVDGGWLRTGDIARVDEAGWWYIVDRLKELIKHKGWQIAPAELERVLMGHPGITDAAVIGIPDGAAGERPVGIVVAGDPALDPVEVMQWVAARVAPYKRLGALRITDALPKSPAGKLLRKDLRRQWAADGTAASTPPDSTAVPVTSDAEERRHARR